LAWPRLDGLNQLSHTPSLCRSGSLPTTVTNKTPPRPRL
jgi:hypothetical protein